jgi:hypothetical protein
MQRMLKLKVNPVVFIKFLMTNLEKWLTQLGGVGKMRTTSTRRRIYSQLDVVSGYSAVW